LNPGFSWVNFKSDSTTVQYNTNSEGMPINSGEIKTQLAYLREKAMVNVVIFSKGRA
jgi:hypothetical protein